MVKRNINFNPGPAALPIDVLRIVQAELLDYQGSGMSILESSHRSSEFEAINDQAIELVRELFGLGTDYKVLFLGGGASTQFALIPMNFIGNGQMAAYVDTGDPLPAWANAVIPIENVEPLVDGKPAPLARQPEVIRIRAAVAPWSHVRPMGEDMVATQLVLPAGHTLRPVDLGAIAGCGHTAVQVARKPRVAVLPTGSELVPIGVDGVSQLLGELFSRSGLDALGFMANLIPNRESTPFLRVLTGFLFGFTTAWFGYPLVEETMRDARSLLAAKFARVTGKPE